MLASEEKLLNKEQHRQGLGIDLGTSGIIVYLDKISDDEAGVGAMKDSVAAGVALGVSTQDHAALLPSGTTAGLIVVRICAD